MDDTVTAEQLAAVKRQLTLVNATIEANLSGNIQSYRRDSGQGATSVVYFNLTELYNLQTRLMNQCAVLQTRLDGSGTFNMRPAW